MQAVSNLPISAWLLAVIWLPRGKTVGSQALIGRFETACIPLVTEFECVNFDRLEPTLPVPLCPMVLFVCKVWVSLPCII